MNETDELLFEIPKGLLKWYRLKPSASVLYTGNDKDALAEELRERCQSVVCTDGFAIFDEGRQQYGQVYDYIISVENLEHHPQPERILKVWKEMIRPDGKLILGMNNRFGLRYFCGDRDPYTGRSFDGIEGYCRAYAAKEDTFTGRMYSRAELKQMLAEAGWDSCRFYSVLADLKNPVLIYAEDCLPREDLAVRFFPVYHYPDAVFLEEEGLYGDLTDNGMFHQMANAYLIECSMDGDHSDVSHVTCSMERGREHAVITTLYKSGVAEKRAAYRQGQKHLEKIVAHGQDLSRHGIPVVEMKMDNGVCVMPYIRGEVGHVYLKKLLEKDKNRFLQKMDQFREMILQSSEILQSDQGNGEGAVLQKGYLDMVPLNSFYLNDTFVFYDQEFCVDHYPANAIIARMVSTFYAGSPGLQKILPASVLYERYGLNQYLERWQTMEWKFLEGLRKEKELRGYHEKCRRDSGIVYSNRQRINYSEEEYQRLFGDVFRYADTGKLILFGSGAYAKKFMALYGKEYPVYAVVDNQKEKWGEKIDGVTIQPPDVLWQLQKEEYKVLICIRKYLSVMKQLDQMGVTRYSIYDPDKSYPDKKYAIHISGKKVEDRCAKKYRVGYIAGVFDLFHIGHLNMFKRAKEQCDYLIAGVVSDEGVRKYKKAETFIPFKERIEMVRACRYVDEAVEIPLHFGGTRDAWRLYHFDCQFSGSDYADHPDWLAEQEFLQRHGAQMVFFPYTESTSSTKIRAMIEKKLV